MSKSVDRFLEGLLVGGLFGYVFGMLSAPKPGSQLRKDIADSSRELYKQAGNSLCDATDKTTQTISNLQHKGEEVLRKASSAIHSSEEQLSSKLDEFAKSSTSMLYNEDEPTQ